ncbi:MAG: signal peptidase I [bacterium]|nr:signal peptidase I [bacterium]
MDNNSFNEPNECVEKAREKTAKNSFLHIIFDFFDCIVVSVVIVALLFSFLFRVVGIEGGSMEDTLIEGDRVIITNMFYKPENGDIVVISRNYNNINNAETDEPIIKRVIAVEGQTVDIDFQKGIVYVDGNAIDEPYIKNLTNRAHDVKFPVTVKKDCVFVLGDNREVSLDSRDERIGMVDTRYILGKAVFRIFPFEKIGGLYNY